MPKGQRLCQEAYPGQFQLTTLRNWLAGHRSATRDITRLDGATLTANEIKANSIVITATASIVRYEPDDVDRHTGGTGTPTEKEKGS